MTFVFLPQLTFVLASTLTVPEPEPEPEPDNPSSPTSVVLDKLVAPTPLEPPSPSPSPSSSLSPSKNKKPVFTPGLQIWTRGQGRINRDLGADRHSQDIAEILLQTRLQARVAWEPLTAMVQFQDSRVWGFETSPGSNEANTDLHQGYLEIGGSSGAKYSGWIRLGRQEIRYGNQRLLGAPGWSLTAQSFDALRMHGEYGKFSVDLLGAIVKPMGIVTQEIPDPTDPDQSITEDARSTGTQLVGGTATGRFHEAVSVELTMLGQRESGQEGFIHFDRRIGNLGARVFGKPAKGLRYDVELNYQWGKNNRRDHSAWAAAATVAYVHGNKGWKPGAHVTYAIASGDDGCTFTESDITNCKSREFFNFYPTNHMHYGLVDLLGWRNMRDLELGAELAFNTVLKIKADYHFLQLHESEGRWSNTGGHTIGNAIQDNKNNNLGHELDLALVIKPWKPLTIKPGYGVFMADDAAKKMANADDNADALKAHHFVYLWIVAAF